MIEAIAAVSAIAGVDSLSAPSSMAENGRADFASMLSREFDKVNTDVAAAESSLQQLASGQPVELHDVMISLEQARIGVQTLIQVRNRMVEAYQDLTRMQI